MENWNVSSCETEIQVDNHGHGQYNHILEQPFWVDELLNEPESPLQRRHLRSSSDSAAVLLLKFNDLVFPADVQMESGECVYPKQHLKRTHCSIAAKPATISKHRSLRIRKLKYIAELESSVQILKEEESQVSAELQYLNQQHLILGMENQVLKQRLDSSSQEQLIKHLEQEMLERELDRLRNLYHQQQEKHNPQSHSREVELQLPNIRNS